MAIQADKSRFYVGLVGLAVMVSNFAFGSVFQVTLFKRGAKIGASNDSTQGLQRQGKHIGPSILAAYS